MKIRRLSYARRESLTGWLFILPFVVGFLLFFSIPLLQTIRYSFYKIEVAPSGIITNPIGWGNFKNALFENADFVPIFVDTVKDVAVSCVGIIIFSLIVANLLNSRFRGRTLARTILFLPVVITAGVVYRSQNNLLSDVLETYMSQGSMAIFDSTTTFLSSAMQVGEGLFDYVLNLVENVSKIIRSSGVQILLYLAGLQTISPSLYEASTVEGATPWESFWKITLPMLSPYILVNIVYTIVDQTGNFGNEVISFLYRITVQSHNYGLGSAVGWIYMLFIAVFLAVVLGIVSRFVFYYD